MNRIWLVILLFLLLSGCQNQQQAPTASTNYHKISGQTMGTSYTITYRSTNNEALQPAIETLLKAINLGVNTYDPEAVISKFNQAAATLPIDTSSYGLHFYVNAKAATTIFKATEGAFDPTVMPLVNYWGFGYTEKRAVTNVDSIKVDSLLALVGYENVELVQDGTSIIARKKIAALQLDFGGIAKGYGVDEIGRLLEQKGIQDYLVDIGGEIRAKGVNKRGVSWQLGINTPSEEAGLTDYLAVIALENRSMATSGNYRNFYEVNGIKYAHTIHPKTGYPELNTLLSTTVIAEECMIADGFATAFMTMGLEKAYAIAVSRSDLEAYFLYSNNDGTLGTKYTKGLSKFLK